jgi:hypothetical protein
MINQNTANKGMQGTIKINFALNMAKTLKAPPTLGSSKRLKEP